MKKFLLATAFVIFSTPAFAITCDAVSFGHKPIVSCFEPHTVLNDFCAYDNCGGKNAEKSKMKNPYAGVFYSNFFDDDEDDEKGKKYHWKHGDKPHGGYNPHIPPSSVDVPSSVGFMGFVLTLLGVGYMSKKRVFVKF